MFATRSFARKSVYFRNSSMLPTANFSSKAFVTQKAPHFEGTAWHKDDFKEISLKDYKGKYLVLFFYPLDFTFVCPTEIVDYSKIASELRKSNCEVVGCSVDSHFTHRQWDLTPKEEGGLGGLDIEGIKY